MKKIIFTEDNQRGDNMKILIFSDLHGGYQFQDENPDCIFLLGDIDYRELAEIDRSYSCPKFGVLGNHDAPSYFEDTSIVNVHGKIVTFNGITIAGFEGCPRYNTRSHTQYYEDEVSAFTDSLSTVDVFLAHSNPQWTLDEDTTNPHRGFQAFSDYIIEKQPRLFLHGHVHTDEVYQKAETTIISVYEPTLINLKINTTS